MNLRACEGAFGPCHIVSWMLQDAANELSRPVPASAASRPVPATDVERFLGRAAPQLPNDNTHGLCLVSLWNVNTGLILLHLKEYRCAADLVLQ